jgi:phenylalanyl-tRNA synthetase beta chain
MKFTYSMLLDYVSTKLTAAEVGDLLTMAGFELEGYEEVNGEPVLDIKVPSNRGDGLSVFGLAREVLAKDSQSCPTDLYHKAVNRFAMPDDGDDGETGCLTSVKIDTTDCSRYACRLFRGINDAETPEWIRHRLETASQRSISLLVDLTNYVMLELGQPLHAFDLDKLDGQRIVVRKARKGEKLTTLNDDVHDLNTQQMMICDASRPVAAAGIMGGLDTEVTGSTQNVLLESAHFLNTSIRRTRKQMGLNTEASYRFERSVDPEGVVAALNRFAQLLAEVVGDESRVQGVVDIYPGKVTCKPVQVRMSRVVRLMGMPVTTEDARGYLERLGMKVTGDGEPFTVVPPSWRPDIVREDDLVEEVGRVHGYDLIPECMPQGSTPQGGALGIYKRVDILRDAALSCGLSQVISHSLRDFHPLDKPNTKRIGPRNPGSPEMAWLRCSLLPCLADAAIRNGGKDLHLFEEGKVFAVEDGPVERKNLALLSTGALAPSHWVKGEVPEADFYSLKGAVETILASIGVKPEFAIGDDPRLHPTRQAAIWAGKKQIGILGQIHPDVAEKVSLPMVTILAEFDVAKVIAASPEKLKYRQVSRNPATRRDIAVLVAKTVSYQTIEQTIAKAGGEVLEKQWLFDVYEGKGIPEGSHSLAIALQLRKMGSNFTDEEANLVRDRVVSALAELGATLR